MMEKNKATEWSSHRSVRTARGTHFHRGDLSRLTRIKRTWLVLLLILSFFFTFLHLFSDISSSGASPLNFINNDFSNNESPTSEIIFNDDWKLGTSSSNLLDVYSNTIHEYDNLEENRPYWFNSSVHDSANLTRDFQSGKIQFQDSGFGEDHNYSLTDDLKNSNQYSNSDFTFEYVNGTGNGSEFNSTEIDFDYDYFRNSLYNYNYSLYEQLFGGPDESMSHTYLPDGYNSTYDISGSLYMYNEFPKRLYLDNWTYWDFETNMFYSDSYFNAYSYVKNDTYFDNNGERISDYYWNATHIFNGIETAFGYYYGTHDFNATMDEGFYYGSPDNFNEDPVGAQDTDIAWVDRIEDSDANIEVMSEIDGHKNILKYSVDSNYKYVQHDFPSAEVSGSREVWLRVSQIDKYVYFEFKGDGSNSLSFLFKNNGMIGYYDDTTLIEIESYSADTWYHYRFDWDCGLGTWDLYINGVKKGTYDLEGSPSTLSYVELNTIIGAELYIDAWGDPADSSYSTGYNLNPYDITQIWDSPFDALYCAHDSYIRVNSSIDGHSDVLELHDGATPLDDARDQVGGMISASSSASLGTVEFWLCGTAMTKIFTFRLRGVSTGVDFQIIDNKIQYYYGGGYNDATGGLILDNAWYHFRIDFDCGTDTYDFYLNGSLLDSDIDFRLPCTTINNMYIISHRFQSDYTCYLDALGFSWDSGYEIGDNLYSCKIEFNVNVDLSHVYNLNASVEDAIDFTNLYYSFQTNIYQLFNLSMYNVKTAQFDLINSSYNNESFYNNLEAFDFNDYINATGHLVLNFKGYNFSTEYQLYLEKLIIEFNWTKQGEKTFASISKDIDYSILNYYDSGYDAYQKLYNVSINVLYRFTNHTSYNENASFTVESTDYSLVTDGSWNSLSHDFTFDSASENDFSVIFNISNGLLQLSELNYSITFICLDTNSKTRLYQSFELDPSFSLTDYQKDDFEIILNFTHSLSASDFDSFDYSHSSVVIFNISIRSEEGWANITYGYNSSASRNFELNIREYLDNHSLERFLDFKVYLWVSGNGTEFSMDDLYLYSMYERVQLTDAPRTDETRCEFVDYLVADRDFDYWYFYNDLEINDVDMTNIRTSEYTDEFDEENDRYYFEDTAQENDVYESYLDYNPNYDIEYEIESDGATADLRIEYSADIAVRNCTLVLDLSDEEIYMENWTYNGEQSSRTFILEIPRINFTTSTRVLRLEGVSEFPNAHFSEFECQELVFIDGTPHTYEYRGYIEYPRYSQAFYLKEISEDWTIDGVHYGSKTMTISSSTGFYECSGYDSSITTSYLKFTADPVDSLTIYDLEEESKLKIEIKLNLPVQNASITFALPSELRYEIRTTLSSLSKIPDIAGYDYYIFFYNGLEEGTNNIYVEYRIHTIEDDSRLYLLIVILSIGFVGLYYYRKKTLEKLETKGMTPEQKKKYLEKKKQNKPESYLSRTWKSLKKQVKEIIPEKKQIKKIKKPRVLH